MIGKVESVEKSKTGKSWRVKIDRKFYGAKFDSHIETALGKPINFTFKSDPQYGDWLESWAYDNSQPQAGPSTIASEPAESRLAEPELRFVSNVVGSAITAKTLTDPIQISVWAKAAAAAVKEL